MLATEAPFPQYFDLDGSPLDDGELYFGVANQNPEIAPIVVYWDAAGLQPAAQPIKTLNGYTVRAGTPALVYAAVDYSLTAKNHRGARVYYSPTSVDYINSASVLADLNALIVGLASTNDFAKAAGQIGYEPTLAYAPKTVGRALKTRVNVMDSIPSNLWAAIENETSTVDVWTYLQAAAVNNAKKDLWVPGGMYRFTRGFYLKTGQCLDGEAGGTLFKALPGSWVGTNGVLGTAPFVWNENNNTTTLTDKDISVENIEFDYDTVVVVGGGCHAVRLRAVLRPRSINNIFRKGENGTAFLACEDGLVDECEAYDQINCPFDNWDGSGRTTVRNCLIRIAPGINTAQGIQATGTGSLLEDRASAVFLFEGNRIYGVRNSISNSAVALMANANDAGSSSARVITIGNYVEDCDIGLCYQGATGQHRSIGDTFRNVDKLPIFLKSDGSGLPSNCEITDPVLIDCNHLPANIAMVLLQGTNNRIKGLRVVNTGAVAYQQIAWLPTSAATCSLEIEKAATGTNGRVVLDSTTSYVRDRDDLDSCLKANPTVASSTTLAPTTGITYVNGVTAIVNITPPPGCARGGFIQLIPTGLWSTTTAGNIALATTAVLNKVLTMTYDPNTLKWYPSY